jgi:hypothetical protein
MTTATRQPNSSAVTRRERWGRLDGVRAAACTGARAGRVPLLQGSLGRGVMGDSFSGRVRGQHRVSQKAWGWR